jgi:hypothetical protein
MPVKPLIHTSWLLSTVKRSGKGEGGMSAKKYSIIAETAPATTTRDLAALVEVGALIRSGELKHTRYALKIPASNIPDISIDENGKLLFSSQGVMHSHLSAGSPGSQRNGQPNRLKIASYGCCPHHR